MNVKHQHHTGMDFSRARCAVPYCGTMQLKQFVYFVANSSLKNKKIISEKKKCNHWGHSVYNGIGQLRFACACILPRCHFRRAKMPQTQNKEYTITQGFPGLKMLIFKEKKNRNKREKKPEMLSKTKTVVAVFALRGRFAFH